MAISTNSVIHYTGEINNLKGILECEGFRLKYCSEALDILLNNSLLAAIPIVSFCDIPLSEVKNHIDSYGQYGIGLSKSWAKKSELNPVLYLERESRLSKEFKTQANLILDYLKENGQKEKGFSEDVQAHFNFITRLITYCKNYEGPLERGKFKSESYRFYDEKEWRYVAKKEEIGNAPWIIHSSEYTKNKLKYNKLVETCYLKFSHKDISYIIIDNENEIPEILNLLHNIYEDKCTTKELKILTTKILTKNQIYNDF
ncbi:MAG: abortive infection system antitoxin AbiGi family protein [Chitinophagaceae bacterium]